VKPLGEAIFGSPVMTADGSKRVRPGDPNDTSAEFVPAGETVRQRNERMAAERRAKIDEAYAEQESYLNEARKKLSTRGWLTQNESEMLTLQLRKMKGNRT
jgi:hypothetical protein